MSQAGLFYFEHVLGEHWEEEITGRVEPVPKPHIRLAADISETRLGQFQGDIVFIRDGGPNSLTPKGAGWTHRENEEMVTIDVRTSQGRARLEGTRTDDNEAERYGGLRGEINRILDYVRKGDQEYDLIEGYEWNDLSEEMGYQFWRGTWEVRLTQIAESIDPEP